MSNDAPCLSLHVSGQYGERDSTERGTFRRYERTVCVPERTKRSRDRDSESDLEVNALVHPREDEHVCL